MKEKKQFLGGLFNKKTTENPVVDKSFEKKIEQKKETKKLVVKGEEKPLTYGFCQHPVPSSSTNPKADKENLGADDLYFQALMQEGLSDFETGTSVPGATHSEVRKEERFRYRPKPVIKKSLVVILLEESILLNGYSNFISRIVDSAIKDNFYAIIRYGEFVNAQVRTDTLFFMDKVEIRSDSKNDKICFYDALKEASKIIDDYENKIIEEEFKRYQIDSIEIIGIGTCTDNSSKTNYEIASVLLDSILHGKVKSKYFCINENFMPNAAMLGFRSIGSLSKEY